MATLTKGELTKSHKLKIQLHWYDGLIERPMHFWKIELERKSITFSVPKTNAINGKKEGLILINFTYSVRWGLHHCHGSCFPRISRKRFEERWHLLHFSLYVASIFSPHFRATLTGKTRLRRQGRKRKVDALRKACVWINRWR